LVLIRDWPEYSNQSRERSDCSRLLDPFLKRRNDSLSRRCRAVSSRFRGADREPRDPHCLPCS
jgi:hypothetical protein